MNNFPLVSIIITSYNRERTVGHAIESALAQDYPNIEIIVSDNCSTDNSDTVIKGYLHDARIKYNRNDLNVGMLGNFEKSINELATGDYFVIANSDDYLTNDKFISEAINLAAKYNDVVIVKSKFKWLSEKTGEITDSPFIIKKEFYEGRDWLLSDNKNFTEKIDILNWAGVMINRHVFVELDIFKTAPFIADICSGILLLLKGNICFLDKYSYMFRFLPDRPKHDAAAIEELYLNTFRAVDFVANHKFNNKFPAGLDNFYRSFYKHVIHYNLLLTYRSDRKQFFKLKDYLQTHHAGILNDITKKAHWRMYSLVHYNMRLGRAISKLKKRKA